MQQLSAKTIEEIIEAIKIAEELKRVYTVLLNESDNICRSHCLSKLESKKLGIEQGSLISVILSMYKPTK